MINNGFYYLLVIEVASMQTSTDMQAFVMGLFIVNKYEGCVDCF